MKARRLIVAISVVAGVTFIVSATFNYLLTPMMADLDLNQNETNLALRIPPIAAMLVVFLAGRLGDRIGHRSIIMWSSVSFVLGSALVASAQGLPFVVIGMLFEALGATSIQIVVVGLITASFPEGKPRESAFASYGMAYPIVFLIFPVVAGFVIGNHSWRLVAWLWVITGIVMFAAAYFFLPRRVERKPVGEVWTLILAGFFVAGMVQIWTHIADFGLVNWTTLTSLVFCAAMFFLLRTLMRRMRSPSLSLAPLRNGATSLLLSIVLLVPMLNTWFYITLSFQYLYELSILATAIAMLPAQVAAIFGAKFVAGKMMARWGTNRSGILLLFALAVTMFGSFTVTPDAPLWMPMTYMAAFGLVSTAVTVVLITAVMGTAPANEAGNTSAFRGSAAAVGSALGYVVMGAIVFGYGGLVLGQELTASGLDASQASATMAQVQQDASSPDTLETYAVPLPNGESITSAEQQAMAAGIRANGVAGAAIAVVSAGLFMFYARRHPD